MSASVLIEAVEAESFGWGGVVAPAFGDVQVAGVFEGRGDGGADGGQVDGPAAGAAGGGVFAARWSAIDGLPGDHLGQGTRTRDTAGASEDHDRSVRRSVTCGI